MNNENSFLEALDGIFKLGELILVSLGIIVGMALPFAIFWGIVYLIRM